MIYDIAVGAFIALVVYDFVSHAAEYVYHRTIDAKRAREFANLLAQYEFSKPKVKAKTTKKTAVKTK